MPELDASSDKFGPQSGEEIERFLQAAQEGIDAANRGELFSSDELRAMIDGWSRRESSLGEPADESPKA